MARLQKQYIPFSPLVLTTLGNYIGYVREIDIVADAPGVGWFEGNLH